MLSKGFFRVFLRRLQPSSGVSYQGGNIASSFKPETGVWETFLEIRFKCDSSESCRSASKTCARPTVCAGEWNSLLSEWGVEGANEWMRNWVPWCIYEHIGAGEEDVSETISPVGMARQEVTPSAPHMRTLTKAVSGATPYIVEQGRELPLKREGTTEGVWEASWCGRGVKGCFGKHAMYGQDGDGVSKTISNMKWNTKVSETTPHYA